MVNVKEEQKVLQCLFKRYSVYRCSKCVVLYNDSEKTPYQCFPRNIQTLKNVSPQPLGNGKNRILKWSCREVKI